MKFGILSVPFCLFIVFFSCYASEPKWMDESIPFERRVDMILNELTLKEKVDLCHAQGKFCTKGVPRLGIPELWYSDGPHGVRAEINWNNWKYADWKDDSCTAFPSLNCLAASFDPAISYDYGKAIGEEARYRKKDVLLGPGVNICRTPLNGRNFEYMGEDPFLASVMVAPYIKGVQSNDVAACVKHYILNNQETDRLKVNVDVGERALREIYMPAFKSAVNAGVWTLMGSYNLYKNQHCCHNELLLNDVLKKEWGFDGAVISDWGGAVNSEQSALYGLDIEMGTNTNGLTSESKKGYNAYYLADDFYKGLKSGKYPESIVNDKSRRIIRLMLHTNLKRKKALGSFATIAHAKTAQKIGEAGIVLLKNKDNILPIKENVNKIAVIGENATRNLMSGGGSSELKPWRIITPLKAIKERYSNAEVVYSRAYDSGKPSYGHEGRPSLDLDSLKKAAVETAKDADLVIFTGGLNKNHKQDCEAADRGSYKLPFGQPEIIKAVSQVNKNIVVVLFSGNAVETSWAKDVKGIVEAWYPGSEAGYSLVSVLSGDVNPSGRLPYTFPVRLKDSPAHYYSDKSMYPGVNKNVYYKEGLLVGYRWYDTKKISVAYPFGFGLSYTTFKLEKSKTDKKIYSKNDTVIVSVPISNTGKMNGSEVVQIYMRDPECSVMRPEKELKGFAKVFLRVGEKKTVNIKIPVVSFAFYDVAGKSWKVEPGQFILCTSTSSSDKDIKSVNKITVE